MERYVVTPLVVGTGGEDEKRHQLRRNMRDAPWLSVVARLRSGVSLEAAQSEMGIIAARLVSQYPDSNEGRGIRVVPLDTWRTEGVRTLLIMLSAAAALVLLACSGNTAAVLLADSYKRQIEMSVRQALGAKRSRLVRLVLVRSVVWSIPGCLLALVFSGLTLAVIDGFAAGSGPLLARLVTVPWVFGGDVLLTLASGLTAGLLASAWTFRAQGLTDALREGGATTSPARYRNLGIEAMVGLQIAIATGLALGAGLLLNSMWNILALDPGFELQRVLAVRVYLPRSEYPRDDDQQAFYERALTQIRSLPNVESAAVTVSAPLTKGMAQINVRFSVGDHETTTKQEVKTLNAHF